MTSLKAELQECKKKIAEYAALEKTRYENFMDFYMQVQNDTKHMREQFVAQMISMTQRTPLTKINMLPCLRSMLENRRQALDVMAETMMQLFVPVSHRYLMYVAENYAEANALPLAKPPSGPEGESLHEVVDKLRVDEIEVLKVEANRNFLKDCALKLRRRLGKFMEYQKKIQDQILQMDVFMVEQLGPGLSFYTITNFIQWVRLVVANYNNGSADG